MRFLSNRFLPLIVLLALASAANAEVLNRIVASIDGEPITLHELEQYARQQRAALAAMGGFATQKELLQALVTEKLVAKEIQSRGVRVTDEDVDLYIEKIREQNRLSEEKLRRALEQQGLSWEAYREQVRGEIQKIQLLNREIRGKVNITDEDVARFYEANKKEYELPATVHLRHIVLRLGRGAPEAVVEGVMERIRTIRERIVEDGEDFAEVAKEVSEDAAAKDGGDLGEVQPGRVLPEFETLLPELEEGEVSEPVRTDGGVHLVLLEKRHPARHVPLEEVSEGIREKLYGKALDERYKRWLLEDLQKRHYVETHL